MTATSIQSSSFAGSEPTLEVAVGRVLVLAGAVFGLSNLFQYGVYSGLLKVAKNQDQLATVIGHELTHVLAQHSNERLSRDQLTGIGLAVADAAIGSSQGGGATMAALGLGVGQLLFVRLAGIGQGPDLITYPAMFVTKYQCNGFGHINIMQTDRVAAQVRGQDAAIYNANNAMSMLQTAEGAFEEMTNIAYRMKELATQAANGTNNSSEYTAMNSEFTALRDEMTNIIENTSYGSGTKLLDGTTGKLTAAVDFQIGSSAAEVLSVDISGDLTSLQCTPICGTAIG